MKITRRQLQLLLQEEIRKVRPGCYKVYPKKPKRGKKRRKALSKKCKTKKAAKRHLAAIEISKKMNESLLLESDHSTVLKRLPGLSLLVNNVRRITTLDLQNNGNLIAAVELRLISNQGEPCIPKTMSITAIHVSSMYQNMGIADLLLDLAFYHVSTLDDGKGRGITTDFESGNTPIINYIIQQQLKDPSYYKQATKEGSTEMDFFEQTADPDDDCYSNLFDEAGVYQSIEFGATPEEALASANLGDEEITFPIGTTSSWRKRGIESMKPIYDRLRLNAFRPGHQGADQVGGFRAAMRTRQFQREYDRTPTPEEIRAFQKDKNLKEGKEPRKGTGKKPKGSSRRLYTDENPKDTVSVKFRTKSDIQDTLSKKSFKSKPHNRQSQIINLIHQRVRAAYKNAKDPATKKRLKAAYNYAKQRKAASKRKTQRMRKKK